MFLGWNPSAARSAIGITLLGFVLNLFGPSAAAQRYRLKDLRAMESPQESKIRDLREHEIKQLRTVLGRRQPKNRRADLYFRLAEIYLEAYRTEFILEGRVHEKRLKRNRRVKIDRSNSKKILNSGIKACKQILELGIPYPKLDRVYYFLGFNYSELGKRTQSTRYYKNLVDKYPKSPFAVEAYRELGEHAFKRHSYNEAIRYFEAGIRSGSSRPVPDIYHKLAWSYYRTKRSSKAISAMKKAISQASDDKEKYLSIQEEALRDMAIFMTETGKVSEAIDYFEDVAGDKDYYANTLVLLAKEYKRKLKHAKAVQVYEALLRARPDSDAAFEVKWDLLQAELKQGKYDEAAKRVEGWEFPSPESLNDEKKRVYLNVRAEVRRTATSRHQKYRSLQKKRRLSKKEKELSRQSLLIADRFYRLYLKKFFKGDEKKKVEFVEIRMYLAEVRSQQGKPAQSAKIYKEVAESGESRFAKQASLLWLANVQKGLKDKKAGKSVSADEKQFIEASDRVSKIASKSKEAREAALRSAQILAGYKSTREEGLERAIKVVETWPASQEGLTAAKLWLQIYEDRLPKSKDVEDGAKYREHLATLESQVKRVGVNKRLMSYDARRGKSQVKKKLTALQETLRVGTIESFEKDKNYSAAAKAYEKFALKVKDPERASKAFSNAISNFLSARDYKSARRTATAWFKRFPRRKDAHEAVRSAATTFFIEGKFELAVQMFKYYSEKLKNRDALETAAQIKEGMGDLKGAIGIRTILEKRFKRASAENSLQMAMLQEKIGDSRGAIKSYNRCVAKRDSFYAECAARIADLYVRLKDQQSAKRYYQKAGGAKGKRGRYSPFVGYGRYRVAVMFEEEGTFTGLRLPESVLKRGLEQRSRFFERLNKSYRRVVDVGGPWAISALNRLARWTLGFAGDVDSIKPPPDAKARSLVKFKKTLQSVSQPLRAKAIATLELAYKKAVKAEVFSPDLPNVADLLGDLGADWPVRAQGFRNRLMLAGTPSDGKKFSIEEVRLALLKKVKSPQIWVDYGNLLYGEGKPVLAKLAYDRALTLDRTNPAALNNRGVVYLTGGGTEDWYRAGQAAASFRAALRAEPFFKESKINLASLLNYYRLFKKSKPLWEQVLVKEKLAIAYDGLAVAVQGLGKFGEAQNFFRKAEDLDADNDRVTRVYHNAAKFSESGEAGFEQCIELLEGVGGNKLRRFEVRAISNLLKTCRRWKEEVSI